MTGHHRAVLLLQVAPELGAHLDADEEEKAAATIVVPSVEVEAGPVDMTDVLSHPSIRGHVHALMVASGRVVDESRIGERPAAQLLGPGEMLLVVGEGGLSVPVAVTRTAISPTTIAVLDDRVIAACRRWPGLIAGLLERALCQAAESHVRQAIAQLPRVEDRLIALLWSLTQTWGRVHRDHVALELDLGHDLLGRLIGARRPTITLGLQQLREDGLIRDRSGGGWLLSLSSLERLLDGDAQAPPETIGAARTRALERLAATPPGGSIRAVRTDRRAATTPVLYVCEDPAGVPPALRDAYAVSHAVDTETAIDAVEGAAVVVVDDGHPDGDDAFVARLCAMPRKRRPRLVVYVNGPSERRVLIAAADHVLPLPVGPADLLGAVGAQIRIGRAGIATGD